MPQLVAIYRSPAYSPLQHRVNDTAILDATVARLAGRGWSTTRTTELDVEQGRLPAAELYLNMCQGSLAAEQLMPLESDGAVVVNRPSSALNCHRHRLVKSLGAGGLAFPRTIIHSSAAPLPPPQQLGMLGTGEAKVWVKRGDVHAERPEDVVTVIIPAFVAPRWWEKLLHNHSGLMLKFALLRKPRIVVTNVRYHLGDHPQVMGATRRPPGVDRSTPPAPAPGRGVEH